MTDDTKLIEAGRFFDNTQAHIMRGILETHDIPCFIFDEHHTTTAWHMSLALGGSRLMILNEDKEVALELLKAHAPEALSKESPDIEKPKETATPYFKNIISIIVSFFTGTLFAFPKSKQDKD